MCGPPLPAGEGQGHDLNTAYFRASHGGVSPDDPQLVGLATDRSFPRPLSRNPAELSCPPPPSDEGRDSGTADGRDAREGGGSPAPMPRHPSTSSVHQHPEGFCGAPTTREAHSHRLSPRPLSPEAPPLPSAHWSQVVSFAHTRVRGGGFCEQLRPPRGSITWEIPRAPGPLHQL